MSFIEDNRLVANSSTTHHGDAIIADKELSLTLENLVVSTFVHFTLAATERRPGPRCLPVGNLLCEAPPREVPVP